MILKNNFNKLKLYQKIELYLLTIMFFGFGYYLLQFIPLTRAIINTTPKYEQKVNYQIKQFMQNIKKEPVNNFIKLFEDKANIYNIQIESMKIDKHKIKLHIIGNYQNSIDFVNYINNHFFVDSFEFKYEKAKLYIDIVINVSYFFNKTIEFNNIENLPNPFVEYEKKHTKKSNNNNISITAIVSNMILVKEKWYKTGDIIIKDKIIKIDLNSVKMQNIKTHKITILKVYCDK